VRIRFHIVPETGESHIYDHGINEDEVAEALEDPIYDTKAEGTFRSAIGQTRAGRYVLVIYTRDPESNSVFVITARELRGKELKAFKRLRRGKKS
jgi:anti-sigma regulatory factor (Ser/Thr protein kinase)